MIKKQFKKIGFKNLLVVILFVILLMILLTISKGLRAIVFVLGFIVVNVFATLYKRYFYMPVEFEILSLGIVLCSVAFDLNAGLIVAILGGIAYTIFCTSFSPFTIPMLFGYSLMAFFSFYIPITNIIYLGILANIIHNIFVFSIYHFIFRYDLGKNILFSTSNILFNIFLFYNLAPFFLRIMG
jgi:hypothetical protein